MRRLFAILLSAFLVLGFAPIAHAGTELNPDREDTSFSASALVPCADNTKFNERASSASTAQDKARFERYSHASCGDDGLPHLIADGRWSHAGEFLLPGVFFLYTAGWIGWAGRSYLQYSKKTDKPNENEIIINVPVAIGMMSSGFLWPFSAWNELVSGDLLVAGDEITVSPR